MAPRRSPVIRDHRTAVAVGLGLLIAGLAVLYDAYEGRGRARPFWMRLFSGWT